MSQSTLSQQIKQLEEEIGHDLFDRTGKRVQLTPEGLILLDYAKRAVVEHEKVIKQIEELKYGIKQTLNIGLAQNSLTVDAGRWVSEAVRLYPELSFKVVFYQFSALVDQMNNGEVDVCFTKQLVRDADFLNNYEYKLIKTNKVIVVAPAEYEFGDKKMLTLKDLDGKNVVLRTKHEKRFLDKCAEYDSYPVVKCLTRSNALKFELVKQRVGFGFFVDCFENINEIDSANLKIYGIEDIRMENKTYLVYPKRKKDCPTLKKFLEVVATDLNLD